MSTNHSLILPASSDAIRRASKLLQEGKLVVFPTETVYGLGANALDPAAVQRIFTAKGRPNNNPIIVHIADATLAPTVVTSWPEKARVLAERFWPGPLTLILPKRPEVPDAVTAGLPNVGIRVPSHPVALALLREAQIPIAAPSANRSTELSPTTAEHVVKSLDSMVDLILDDGQCPGGIESTVLDLTSNPPRILRPGMVTQADLEPIIGTVADSTVINPNQPLPSPGLMERHYAPRTPLELAADDGANRVQELLSEGKRVGWLTWSGSRIINGARRIDMSTDSRQYAHHLYAALHHADAWGVDCIVMADPPNETEWFAVRDRLSRAAHN